MSTTSYSKDATQSRRDFNTYGLYALAEYFGTNLIFPTEAHQNEFETALDRNHGIDAIVIDSDGVIHGVSSRFQHGKDYSAFSRRLTRSSGRPTEHEKDLLAVQAGQVTCDYCLQGFVVHDDDGTTANIGIAPSSSIRRYIADNPTAIHTNRADGNKFLSIPFAAVGAKVFTFKIPF